MLSVLDPQSPTASLLLSCRGNLCACAVPPLMNVGTAYGYQLLVQLKVVGVMRAVVECMLPHINVFFLQR